MKKQSYIGELSAEFLGSMFLVMAVIAPAIMFTEVLEASAGVTLLANAIAVAFVLCAVIEIFGPVSGAHFNPVVTLVMLFEKKICALKAVLFMLFQFMGGIVGTIFSRLMFRGHVNYVIEISESVRNEYMFFGEIFGTFILVLAVLLLVKAGSNKIGIVVGFLVGGQILSTSSTMFANPQVTVARMFTSTAAGIRPIDGLVFIGLQIGGALLAYAVYRLVFSKNTPQVEEK